MPRAWLGGPGTNPGLIFTPAAFGKQDDYRDDELAISDVMIRNGLLDVIITAGHPEYGSIRCAENTELQHHQQR